MNAFERHSRIVDMANRSGRVTIPEICKAFLISDMTARRDLAELDRRGLLRRVHGGAVANLGRSYEPPFENRESKNQAVKAIIGRSAAGLVLNGDSISLDVGTTTLEIVPGLKGKSNLTIVTSCLPIANLIVQTLALEVDVRLILSGGILRPREHSMIGGIPQMVFEQLHVDKAFIGVAGVSPDDGLTEYNIDDSEIKKVLLRSAREKIVVADGSKFGVTTFASIGPLTAIDRIVTDHSAPTAIIERIRKLDVDVIVAD
jgi:DeoR/GlpR family transcriptional regulator of sugar metabolism